jgi:hypothetical protein
MRHGCSIQLSTTSTEQEPRCHVFRRLFVRQMSQTDEPHQPHYSSLPSGSLRRRCSHTRQMSFSLHIYGQLHRPIPCLLMENDPSSQPCGSPSRYGTSSAKPRVCVCVGRRVDQQDRVYNLPFPTTWSRTSHPRPRSHPQKHTKAAEVSRSLFLLSSFKSCQRAALFRTTTLPRLGT